MDGLGLTLFRARTDSLPLNVTAEGVSSWNHGHLTERDPIYSSWSPEGLATEPVEGWARVTLTMAPPQALLATAAPHWDSHPRLPQRFWDTREATCASFTAGVKFTVAFRCLETGKVSDRD